MKACRTVPCRCRMTMVELIMAMSILLLLMTFLGTLIHRLQRISEVQRAQSELYEQQRLFFDIITRDLQGMMASTTDGARINYSFDPAEIGGFNPVFKALFVSSSAIGVTKTDSSTLMEVGYSFSDSTVYRWYTTSGDGNNAKWNFYNYNDTTVDWGKPDDPAGFDDSAVLASSVDSLEMQAYRIDPAGSYAEIQYNGTYPDTYVIPDFIRVEITMFDPRMKGTEWSHDTEVKKSWKTFSKIIYLNRSY